jgi:predicted CopG family antitoxin
MIGNYIFVNDAIKSEGFSMPKEGYRVITVKADIYDRLATVAKNQDKSIQDVLATFVEGLRGFESLFPHHSPETIKSTSELPFRGSGYSI